MADESAPPKAKWPTLVVLGEAHLDLAARFLEVPDCRQSVHWTGDRSTPASFLFARNSGLSRKLQHGIRKHCATGQDIRHGASTVAERGREQDNHQRGPYAVHGQISNLPSLQGGKRASVTQEARIEPRRPCQADEQNEILALTYREVPPSALGWMFLTYKPVDKKAQDAL